MLGYRKFRKSGLLTGDIDRDFLRINGISVWCVAEVDRVRARFHIVENISAIRIGRARSDSHAGCAPKLKEGTGNGHPGVLDGRFDQNERLCTLCEIDRGNTAFRHSRRLRGIDQNIACRHADLLNDIVAIVEVL